jgi:hypothetical protein
MSVRTHVRIDELNCKNRATRFRALHANLGVQTVAV